MAMPRPIPRLPPVTNAVLPDKSKSVSVFEFIEDMMAYTQAMTYSISK
jgi:hypothetical protein